ncbi:MAG: hypothetical protein RMK20_05425, partial [Verrucomicrobiales bacterium]|nr:hypothetical protein [Verrucomicrobiales bacterium]
MPLAFAAVVVAAGWALPRGSFATDGSVWVWGIGSGIHIVTNPPAAATNLLAISAGLNFMVGLRADRSLIARGDNSFGQTSIPASATNVVAIAAGHQHGLALRAKGTILAWGGTDSAQVAVPFR